MLRCDKTLISDILRGAFESNSIVSSGRVLTDLPSVEERLPEIKTSASSLSDRGQRMGHRVAGRPSDARRPQSFLNPSMNVDNGLINSFQCKSGSYHAFIITSSLFHAADSQTTLSIIPVVDQAMGA